MSSGVLVGSIAEAKIFVVLGFWEVEGMKIPPLACLKFIISFCKYGITPPSGYREWERKQSGFRFKNKVKIRKNIKKQDWDAGQRINLRSKCLEYILDTIYLLEILC